MYNNRKRFLQRGPFYSPRKLFSQKSEVLVVGSGWAGFRIAADLDKNKYNVHVVSPRNHFLFTPLLPSTAVGTLEFRAIQEPVRTIPKIQYYQASVTTIDFDRNMAHCVDAYKPDHEFDLKYDIAILSPGSENNTFGVNIQDNHRVFFLKQLEHSRAIRNRLIECFERASSPSCTETEVRNLLSFIVVGGGPTSVEFAAELYDFINKDVSRWYPDLTPLIEITLVEASGHILGSFHQSIVSYVESVFKSRTVNVLMGVAVTAVNDCTAELSDGRKIPFGLMVWSTGVKQVPLIQDLSPTVVSKAKQGRLEVDNMLRVLSAKSPEDSSAGSARKPIFCGSVYALGDCAANVDKPLPPLAQVANQQAIYLAKMLNKHGQGKFPAPFKYAHLGSMAQIGDWQGVIDSTNIGLAGQDAKGTYLKGVLAFLLWRAAYWTKQVSLVNKVLIPMYWLKSMLFGRDISRF